MGNQCQTKDCSNNIEEPHKYCDDHECEDKSCAQAKTNGHRYCSAHATVYECSVGGCTQDKTTGGTLCTTHQCFAKGCFSPKLAGGSCCLEHACTKCKRIRAGKDGKCTGCGMKDVKAVIKAATKAMKNVSKLHEKRLETEKGVKSALASFRKAVRAHENASQTFQEAATELHQMYNQVKDTPEAKADEFQKVLADPENKKLIRLIKKTNKQAAAGPAAAAAAQPPLKKQKGAGL